MKTDRLSENIVDIFQRFSKSYGTTVVFMAFKANQENAIFSRSRESNTGDN